MMSRMNGNTIKRSRLQSFSLIMMLAVVMTACGSGKISNENMTEAAPAAMAEEYAYDMAAYDGGVVFNSAASAGAAEYEMAEAEETYAQEEGGQSTVAAPETSRKLIKTVNISAETENFDTLVPGLQKQVETLGGYIESISVYDVGSYYVEDTMQKQRCANLTARVPKEKLDGFLLQVGEQTNMTSRSENVEDVTLRYVDLESHKKALLTEQERLLALMEKAESVEDIITIEGRLSEVRYQLESMESQLRTYDNQIDYSTVYLSIEEVRKYSAPQTATVWQRIGNGFMKSLENIGFGIRDFAIGFVIDIPYIVFCGVLIAVAVIVFRILWKTWKKMVAKRAASREKKETEQKNNE
ncbi:MAG: DUF4349 domain-containing protein [Lachnospiraceae bacterium]|nr:DUF4349 domain-containing protein [Lachnospiraceae bacterium]